MNSQESENRQISFSVDAGLIDRLGRELVGKAETAVSELIKNAYDADAKNVDVTFINSYISGGTIEISDDGLGMSFEQLKAGFMTISSTDKVHNPISIKFSRSKAGKKGIGRFATQRLGTKLTIITQTLQSEKALKLTIDWSKYTPDQDIRAIINPVLEIDKIKAEGTLLIIEHLRESWSEATIKRIYRYVADLFQPDYLSKDSTEKGIATKDNTTFNVRFFERFGSSLNEVASPQVLLFDKNLAVIEGFVDKLGDGFVGVKSDRLALDDYGIEIHNSRSQSKYSVLKNVHFKAYYYIYNRTEYYTDITSLELSNILKISHESSGIRLYRNGFRVLPYGEAKDDWLGLDIRYSGDSAQTNIPFSNNNFFGFVEILDQQGELFQETASREGLIENDAFNELVEFLSKAFSAARLRIAEKITEIRKKPKQTPDSNISDNNLDDSNENSENEDGQSENLEDNKSIEDEFDELDEELNKNDENEAAKEAIKSIKEKYYEVLEELNMLRILASLGLTIGEFTHEIIQFTPSIDGFISKLFENSKDDYTQDILQKLKNTFANITSYTSYFNATISENTSREARPVLISDIVSDFAKNIQDDIERQHSVLEVDSYGYSLYTIPMHKSEWNSILYNLYTNAKKAIKRNGDSGIMRILSGEENNMIYLEFHDNGDGIPSENKTRIFNAFFTTSSPAGFDAPLDEKLTGTGLGLKIVKDIIETHRGRIFLAVPDDGFKTCFRIEVPKASNIQLEEYGI